MYNVQLSVGNRRLDEKFRDNKEQFHRVMECLGRNVDVEDNILKLLREYTDIIADETECYWYHSDHLGSSSWITYTDGAAVQHLHYLPWGEGFVDQRSTSFTSRYTFSAKEKDTETGYSYFGARYYSSDLSIWLSVDPMSDKYPSLSPYVYCANNPIKLVDPNGREIGAYYDLHGNYLGWDGVCDDKVYLVDHGGSQSYIKNKNREKEITAADDPNIQIAHTTSYRDISKALDVFDQMRENGGKSEEGGAYDSQGNWCQGEGYSANVTLPISAGQTTIHGHPWNESFDSGGNYRSPEYISPADINTFSGFQSNIIVGYTAGEYKSFEGFTDRKAYMYFYGNQVSEKKPFADCRRSIEAIRRIRDRGIQKGHY